MMSNYWVLYSLLVLPCVVPGVLMRDVCSFGAVCSRFVRADLIVGLAFDRYYWVLMVVRLFVVVVEWLAE